VGFCPGRELFSGPLRRSMKAGRRIWEFAGGRGDWAPGGLQVQHCEEFIRADVMVRRNPLEDARQRPGLDWMMAGNNLVVLAVELGCDAELALRGSRGPGRLGHDAQVLLPPWPLWWVKEWLVEGCGIPPFHDETVEGWGTWCVCRGEFSIDPSKTQTSSGTSHNDSVAGLDACNEGEVAA